jgi:hypothetical protein
MTWYRYWATLGHNAILKETYRLLTDDYDEETIEIDCHDWAEKYGSNSFKYNFEVIDRPPKAWLIKKINSERLRISEIEKKVKIYDEILKIDLRKDKIKRLRNIINNV